MNKYDYKGIILAGGSGTRLYPLTKIISKQLLPIYNKPMIYYPLELLIKADIKDILIITTKEDIDKFEYLLGNGNGLGVNLTYMIQSKPEGIAQALVIAEEWIDASPVALILGDNLFFGKKLNKIIKNTLKMNTGVTIFCKEVENPERFGVVEVDENSKVLNIIEKPNKPSSNYVATGLYIYDKSASEYAKKLTKSERGEFEITDLNKIYLNMEKLDAVLLDKDFSWLDTGTFDTLLEAAIFVKENKEFL